MTPADLDEPLDTRRQPDGATAARPSSQDCAVEPRGISPIIESPANPRVRAAVALRERRDRDATGLTLVDGGREARRAIERGVDVETAFVCRSLLTSQDARLALAALGRGHGRREIVEVGPRAFERLAFGDRADGIVLVVRPPEATLDALRLPADPLVVITEDVEKPGNLGAILRTADAAGVDAVIAAGGTDLFNPNVIRASIGTVFTVPLAAATTPDEAREWAKRQRLRLVVARVDAERVYADANLGGRVAIVLGSEATGLSESWAGRGVEAVRLPMLGVADSLNVSVAGAVLLYEAWRQRRPAASESG
jgi:TrmH family RNA methyltransferase